MTQDPFAPVDINLSLSQIRRIEEKAETLSPDPIAEAADPYYEPYFCDLIQSMAEGVKFPEQWAAELGVTERDLVKWRHKFPDFARAYALALTKLRAAFTEEMWKRAREPVKFNNGPLLALIAKKRFADLYGDRDPAPPQDPGGDQMRDVTPGGMTIEGNISESRAQSLQRELEDLRRRQEDE